MKTALRALAAAALACVLGTGCRPDSGRGEPFEAWETGRTLIFENPNLADAGARFQQRLQKQVIRSEEASGARTVDLSYTSFQGRHGLRLVLKDGGVSMLDSVNRQLVLLPAGFPERTGSWDVGGYRLRVLGRARWGRETPTFPATRPPEGVWVEGEPLQGGVRIRVFFLPGFGEVEKREWRDGRWVTTNLMVGWSFQEVPRAGGG